MPDTLSSYTCMRAQNVSDVLSSMAFMTVASHFPSKRFKLGLRRLAAALPDPADGAAAEEGVVAHEQGEQQQAGEQVRLASLNRLCCHLCVNQSTCLGWLSVACCLLIAPCRCCAHAQRERTSYASPYGFDDNHVLGVGDDMVSLQFRGLFFSARSAAPS
jgi:hypothetical protein